LGSTFRVEAGSAVTKAVQSAEMTRRLFPKACLPGQMRLECPFHFMKRILIGLFCVFVFSLQAASRRPNILFAIADDWGFGHASAYGAK